MKSDIRLWALDMESILKFDATNGNCNNNFKINRIIQGILAGGEDSLGIFTNYRIFGIPKDPHPKKFTDGS
ncbi:unnamed protein product [Rhizophagus irregularis]|nr:unnamed protein product [Rhizophagus irregularis]